MSWKSFGACGTFDRTWLYRSRIRVFSVSNSALCVLPSGILKATLVTASSTAEVAVIPPTEAAAAAAAAAAGSSKAESGSKAAEPAAAPAVPPPLPPLPEGLGDIAEFFSDESSLPPPPLPPMPSAALAGFAHKESVMSNLSFGSGGTDEIEEAEVPLQYRALYDYQAAQADDLTLVQNEIVYVLVVRDDGWMQGLNTRGEVGFFPQTYVQVLDDMEDSGFAMPHIVEVPPCKDSSMGFTLKDGVPVSVEQVTPGSPAAEAGLRVGDLILEHNSEPCAEIGLSGLTHALFKSGPHAPHRLCVLSQPFALNE
eukprot:m.287042 g.287042  ORF g.287042 m.287042 type:complete len:311 (+) comp22928_c6_seq24:149-1081(+)